jgi:hypothetical protein
MDLMACDVPIPNLIDYSLMLFDEDDITKRDQKFMSLAGESDEVLLPNTIVHTVMSKSFMTFRFCGQPHLLGHKFERGYRSLRIQQLGKST